MNEHIGYMLAAALNGYDRLGLSDQSMAIDMARIASDPKATTEERDAAAGTLAEIFDERPMDVRTFDLGDPQ